jgi:hypothetical protein
MKRKRADVSKKDDSKKETAKPKASSSGGEHPTDEHPTDEFKRTDTHAHEYGKAKPGDSISGGDHPTEDFTLIFADTCAYGPGVHEWMTHDARPPISENDVKDTADEFEPDVLIYPRRLAEEGVQWNITTGKNFKEEYIKGCQLGLEYPHSSSTIVLQPVGINIIMLRILKGIAGHASHYSPETRLEVSFAVLDYLWHMDGPTLVVGNLGFSLSHIAAMFTEYYEETRRDIKSYVQVQLSADQEIIALYKGPHVIHTVDANQNSRIFILKFKSNSGGTHPAVLERSCSSGDGLANISIARDNDSDSASAIGLKSSLACIRELPTPMQKKAKLTALLVLRPVHLTTHFDTTDGTHISGPIDVEQSVSYFENSLEIIKSARRHAGVTRDNQTLTKCEFARARSWLQAIFEEKFMRNGEIKDRIKKLDAVPHSFTRKDKKMLRDGRRGAFNTWQKDLFGNTPLLNAFLQAGMFDCPRRHQDTTTKPITQHDAQILHCMSSDGQIF